MTKAVVTLGVALTLVALAPLAGGSAAQAQEQRPRVAVIAFKNPTSWWGRELGASAASQLTTKLVQLGAFTVLERDRTKEIFDEWYLGQSGAVDQSQAAQMGKLHGVDYLITGEFQSFNIRSRRVGFGSVAVNQTVAESALNVRAINVTTGEVVVATGHKGDKRLGTGGAFRNTRYQEITTTSAWNPTIAEDALSEAIDKVAADLMSQRSKFTVASSAPATGGGTAPSAPASTVPGIAGVAADGSIYIDQGQNAGIAVGQRFHVLRVVDVIRDAQGNELDKVTKRVGIIEVAQVLSRSAICKVIEGTPDPKDLLEAM